MDRLSLNLEEDHNFLSKTGSIIIISCVKVQSDWTLTEATQAGSLYNWNQTHLTFTGPLWRAHKTRQECFQYLLFIIWTYWSTPLPPGTKPFSSWQVDEKEEVGSVKLYPNWQTKSLFNCSPLNPPDLLWSTLGLSEVVILQKPISDSVLMQALIVTIILSFKDTLPTNPVSHCWWIFTAEFTSGLVLLWQSIHIKSSQFYFYRAKSQHRLSRGILHLE